MGGTGRTTLESGLDECRHFTGGISRLSSTPRGDFPQAVNPLLQEATPPKSDRLEVDLVRLGDVPVLPSGGGLQHDATALRHLLRSSMRTDPLLKFETIFGFKLNCPSNARHGLILESKTNNSSHLCDTTLGLPANRWSASREGVG